MAHICEICNKDFKTKYNLHRHMNKKKPCKKKDDYVTNNYICVFCNETYSSKSNLNKHLIKCKDNNLLNISKKKEEFYLDQIDNMKHQINHLIKNSGTKTTYYNQINQSFQQNININSYGNENLNYITGKDVESLISDPRTCIPKFIELLHYNEGHPENHNIILDNIKGVLIKTLKKDDRWVYSIFEKFIDKFTVEKYDQLIDLYEDTNNSKDINEIIQKKFELWADDFDYCNNNVREKVKEDVKLALISGSEWIKNNMTKRGLKKILKKNDNSKLEIKKII